MEINRNNILEIVHKADIKPDKDYGQNFLLDTNIASDIVTKLDVKEDDLVLEIGPGLGSLTHFLADSKARVSIVDIDKRMTDFLKIIYGQKDNVEIILNDIRKVDISKYTKIIGNLPYNITTEVVVYLLLNAISAKKMVLMCQSEAFFRFFDVEGKDYGPISVLIHLIGEIKKVLVVKPGSFYPAPKCNSTVFEINIDYHHNREEAIKVYKMCKSLFTNRRKTILNNLKMSLKNPSFAEPLCDQCHIPITTRPENITPEQYYELYLAIQKIEKNEN